MSPSTGDDVTADEFVSRYSVGESLQLNCSSEATLPPANLTWYINQRPVGQHVLQSKIFSSVGVKCGCLQVSPEQLVKYPILNMSTGQDETLHTAVLGLNHKVSRCPKDCLFIYLIFCPLLSPFFYTY